MSKVFKVITIGDAGTGKTSIAYRFVNKEFDETIPSTIGVEFYTKSMTIDDKEYKCQIWDLAGMDKYRSIIRAYYNNVNGIILVYNIANGRSFHNLESWIVEISQYYNLEDLAHRPPIILVGNKCDLEYQRVVTKEYVLKFAEKYCIYDMIECSAKSGYNVDKIFDILSYKIVDRVEKGFMEYKKMINNIKPMIENTPKDRYCYCIII